MMRRRLGIRCACWLAVMASAIGCTAADETARERTALLELELTRGPTLWSAPEDGADGAPEFEVRWSPDGAIFPTRAIAAARWGDAAAVLAADGRLHRFHRDGRAEPIADEVSTPLVAQDGLTLGYAAGAAYGPMDVHIIDPAGRDRVVARSVLSPALLGFDLEARALSLLAAGPGGVMGEHVIDLEAGEPSARCLTNCELRTGEDWGDAFVELPEQVER